MSRKVLVVAETRGGNVRNVTFEALAAAHRIAEGGGVAAAVFGTGAAGHVAVLGEYGADKVYVVPNEKLDQYTTDGYSQAICEVINQFQPDAIFIGHTAIGKDVAPRLAAKLSVGLISDVTDVTIEDGEVVFTRPIYAGKAFQKKRVSGNTIFATIRPNNIALGEADLSKTPEQIDLSVDIKDLRTIVKDVVRKAIGRVELTEAKIVVSGGRGVKSAEGFAPLQALADVLGAAVGASRGACDAGYCDYAMQVGQTGKVVTPDLYIACGISGAIQHIAGMSNSKIIVAINKDPEAPIFNVADYGIVGDLFEVVPLLTEEFKKELQGAAV